MLCHKDIHHPIPKNKMLLFVLQILSMAENDRCSYSYGLWNVQAKKIVRWVSIEKHRSELRRDEIGDFGCTPCVEDQIEIKLRNGITFTACRHIAPVIEDALNESIENNFTIVSVEGYRPTMTRGAVDEKGNRTVLSNHAFGAAFDINRAYNGLYNNCVQLGPQCNLIQGGHWSPDNPLSLTKDHPLVQNMTSLGFRWGGEIQGRQKDMMHFSKTGY